MVISYRISANRSVGIVFSPTLNIPAPVFSLFITEYDTVFDEPDDSQPNNSSNPTGDPPPYSAYNDTRASPPTSQPNNLGVPESQSHRRFPSADHGVPRASPQPPPSFPMHPQGYQRQPQSYQQYPPQQYAYQHQVYPQYSAQPVARWNDRREESNDLFG